MIYKVHTVDVAVYKTIMIFHASRQYHGIYVFDICKSDSGSWGSVSLSNNDKLKIKQSLKLWWRRDTLPLMTVDHQSQKWWKGQRLIGGMCEHHIMRLTSNIINIIDLQGCMKLDVFYDSIFYPF